MHLSKEGLEALLRVQELDLEIARAQKRFDELPQRERVTLLREKKQSIARKRGEVADMAREVDRELAIVNNEDERLQEKQTSIQEKIDHAGGDYRAVENHSKELNGVAKRRNTLEEQGLALHEKEAQITAIKTQIDEAFDTLSSEEENAINSFKQEGRVLQEEIAALTQARDKKLGSLDSAIREAYDKKMKQFGGVALARLQGSTCSVCRSSFEGGRLLQLQNEAPLSECPSCRRMLVIEDA